MSKPSLQDILEAHVASLQVSRLLDIGCGDGAATRRLILAGLNTEQVTGVDTEDNGFTADVSGGLSGDTSEEGRAIAGPGCDFILGDAHCVVGSSVLHGYPPDIVVAGRMLHHVPRFGTLLEAVSALLRRSAEFHGSSVRLVIWEPIADDGPLSELHRIKAYVDRSLGLWHHEPFSREVLDRVLSTKVCGSDIRWERLEVVHASRESYTETEFRNAVSSMHDYVGLVRDDKTVYAHCKRRLALLPSTAIQQPFGEPLLPAIATVYPPGRGTP